MIFWAADTGVTAPTIAMDADPVEPPAAAAAAKAAKAKAAAQKQ